MCMTSEEERTKAICKPGCDDDDDALSVHPISISMLKKEWVGLLFCQLGCYVSLLQLSMALVEREYFLLRKLHSC